MGNLFNNLITIPLYNILIFFFAFVRDMGLSVILLTILVRLLLIKQSVKAEKSRLALQKLQPELTKIQKQYKDDKEAQAKAMMALYQKKGISPFSSCGATLIQMPFLIGLFIVFKEGLKNGFTLYGPVKSLVSGITISSVSLGIIDLTKIPNQGWLIAFPIIAASVQYIQARMMMTKSTPGTKNPANTTLLILPAITLLFTMSLPMALSLYWIATTLFAIVQQILIDKYETKKEEETKNA